MSYLLSELNYHTIKFFTENLLAIEMTRTKITVNKLVYLGLLILYIRKTKLYKFWYDYIKGKYNGRKTLCFMDTDNLICPIKEEKICKKILKDVEQDSVPHVNMTSPMGKAKRWLV